MIPMWCIEYDQQPYVSIVMEWSSATLPSSPWLTVTSLNHELRKNLSSLRLLLPCILSVMKKVTNSSNALYHGPLCKCVEWHCCCYCVEWDCSKIYLRATLQQKAQWWAQWTQIQSYIRCCFSSHFINVAFAK